MERYDLIVVGGGAAGVFAAISAKSQHPHAKVLLLEKSAVLLSKVRVSGGGRCNVTHNCFDPRLLSQNYPRGEKELIGPFNRFQPRDTIDWFNKRGVELKSEADGRIFPVTDCSETIIDCLLGEAERVGVEIRTRIAIESVAKKEDSFQLSLKKGDALHCSYLILATGSAADGHRFAAELGHTIIPPVPSLFTFNVPTSPLKELSGIAVNPVELRIKGSPLVQKGPLLITHFGFSGPAALKLSAWGARFLHEKNYEVELLINWLPELTERDILEQLTLRKKEAPQKMLVTENPFGLPKNLWRLLSPLAKRYSDISGKEIEGIARKLHSDSYLAQGKTTHKEEFVTCGGVHLKEIDFKKMESKICPRLFFAGEILNIDGITGGFNFQNGWTTGFIAGQSSCSEQPTDHTLPHLENLT